MKTLVIYYSMSGSNKYLAEKIARTLQCDIEAIKPRLDIFPFMILSSLLKIGLGNAPIGKKVADYDRLILCGPIFMGQFIAPLRNFTITYKSAINKLYFVTCCGGGDATKDGKFGYGSVFKKVKTILGDKCTLCEAFPIDLVLPSDKKDASDTIMKTRLSDANFTGKAQARFNAFIQNIGT